MSAIAFDKMCLMTGLTWNHLKDQGVVGWAVPYMPAPGIHGHGPKLYAAAEKKDGPFIIDFLKMESLLFGPLVLNTFVLSPTPTKEESSVKAVESALEEGSIGGHVGAEGVLTEEEKAIVYEMSKVVVLLSAKEIQVLGVHSGLMRTVEAIEFNASFWCRLAMKSVESVIGNRSTKTAVDGKICELLKELLRKSGLDPVNGSRNATEGLGGNEPVYRAARGKISKAKGIDDRVKASVLHVCPEADELWVHDGRVPKWRKAVRLIEKFTAFLRGLDAAVVARNSSGARVSGHLNQQVLAGEEARAHLASEGYALPTYDEIMTKPSAATGRICGILRALIMGLPKAVFPEHWVNLPTTGTA